MNSNIKKNLIVQIEISDHCNSACPLCCRSTHFIENNEKIFDVRIGKFSPIINTRNISLNDFKNWFPENILKTKIKEFSIYGNYGDPACNSNLIDICRYIVDSDNSILIKISSNGGIQSVEWWRELGRILGNNKNNEVVFFIDGLEDTNSIYRQGVDYYKVIKNTKAFISEGGKAFWGFLKFGHNEHQINEAIKRAKLLKFSGFDMKVASGFSTDDEKIEFIDLNGNRQNISPSSKKNHIYIKGKAKFPYNIQCNSYNKKIIFIDNHGVVSECCWIGRRIRHIFPEYYTKKDIKRYDEFWNNSSTRKRKSNLLKDIINSLGGIESLSLFKNSLDEIINNRKLMRELYKSWEYKIPNFCADYCSTNRNLNGIKGRYHTSKSGKHYRINF